MSRIRFSQNGGLRYHINDAASTKTICGEIVGKLLHEAVTEQSLANRDERICSSCYEEFRRRGYKAGT